MIPAFLIASIVTCAPFPGPESTTGGADAGDDDLDCETIEDEALALRESYQSCDGGLTCELVSLYDIAGDNNCLMAFQCDGAFPVGADLTDLTAEAAVLTERMLECGQCGIAGCTGEVVATCNETTGLCEVVTSHSDEDE